MLEVFGVVVYHRSIVNWSWGVYLSSVYMHSAICVTYLVQWYFRDLLSIGLGGTCILSFCAFCLYVKLIWCNVLSIGVRGNMYAQYMCIVLYVKLMWCNSIP